eukprot:COSAG02_NODE_3150_length_7280_cov_8.158892_4_plen_651_part_00
MRKGTWPALRPPTHCHSALQAAKLRLVLCFLQSDRLTADCPVLLMEGGILETIAAWFVEEDWRVEPRAIAKMPEGKLVVVTYGLGSEGEFLLRDANGNNSGSIKAKLLTRPTGFEADYEALLHSWRVWCDYGVIAKGKLGVVTEDMNHNGMVTLRFASGEYDYRKGFNVDSLTQATAFDAGYDALMQSWMIWCSKGAIAKTAEGRLGVVVEIDVEMDSDDDDDGDGILDEKLACAKDDNDATVKLRFADGESGYIKVGSLAQATPSDVGYEALVRAQAKIAWCKKGAIAKTAEGKLGVVSHDPGQRRKGKQKTLESDVRLRFADGKESGPISANLLTQAMPSDVGYDALMHSPLVWCKQGAIAKTAEGRLGVVTPHKNPCKKYSEYPSDDSLLRFRLRFADGESESRRYTIADSLTQATPSDAGYEALMQAEWYQQATQRYQQATQRKAEMKAKTAWCKKGVIVNTVNEGQPGVVCAMARYAVEQRRRHGGKPLKKTAESDVRLRFADGKESGRISANLLTQAMPSDVGYDALMHSSLVWCKQGAIAKTAEGRLGVVDEIRLTVSWPEAAVYSVRLQFADGECEHNIMADSLTQATPADAGYEALVCVQAKLYTHCTDTVLRGHTLFRGHTLLRGYKLCSEEESGDESEE